MSVLSQVDVTNCWRGRRCFAAYLWNAGEKLAGKSLHGVRLRMARAWTRSLALDLDSVLPGPPHLDAELSQLDARSAHALQAVRLALRDDCVAALPIALACIDGAPAQSRLVSIARTVCRLAYWKLGDWARFQDTGALPSTTAKKGDLGLQAFDGALEAAIELQQLRFGAASRLAQDVLALVPGRRPCVHTGLASVLATALLFQLRYEHGALAEAEESVRNLLPLIRERGCAEAVLRVYPLLAKIARHRAHGDLAMLTLTEGEALGSKRGWSRLVAACLEERVELLVRAGRLDEAEMCLERMRALFVGQGHSHYVQLAVHRHFTLARARIDLTRAPSFKILLTLKRLHREATAGGDLYLAAQLATRVAEAYAALEEATDATETLVSALELGAKVGMYQSFVDGGPLIGELLRSIAAEGEPPGRRFLLPYMKSVLRGWQMANQGTASEDVQSTLRLTGPLSAREHRILQLISRGHSNKRVARELSIAPETVKSHAKHIFVKLGAQTRMEAVSRATTLGLI